MQVVILCGGLGTRLRDISENLPKPMVPIGTQPILWHIMKGFAQYRLREFVLCLGYQSWLIKRYFLDYHMANADFRLDLRDPSHVELLGQNPGEDWQITFAETGLNAQTGCRLKRIERHLYGEDFLLTYGDGLSNVDLNALISFHRSHGRLATVTAVRPPGRFGEIETIGERVTSFNEKPTVSRGRINGGFMLFRREFLDRLRDEESLVLEQEPLMRLAREGELMAFEHDGFWHPMDTSRDHRILTELWESGSAPWKTWDAPLPCSSREMSAERYLVPVGAGPRPTGAMTTNLNRPLPRKPR